LTFPGRTEEHHVAGLKHLVDVFDRRPDAKDIFLGHARQDAFRVRVEEHDASTLDGAILCEDLAAVFELDSINRVDGGESNPGEKKDRETGKD
jgi:hypothetical protein